jgi:hypothetical protein
VGVLFLAIILAAGIGVGYMLGMLLLNPKPGSFGSSIGAFVLGFTLLALISLVPILGIVLTIIAMVMGFGAIWLAKGFVEPGQELASTVKSSQPDTKPVAVKPEDIKPGQPILNVAQESEKPQAWTPAIPAFRMKKESSTTRRQQKAGSPDMRKTRAAISRGKTKKAVSRKTVQKNPAKR